MPRRSTQYAETAEEENWDLDFDMFPDDASASGESEQDWPGNADAWSDGAQYTPLRTRARARPAASPSGRTNTEALINAERGPLEIR